MKTNDEKMIEIVGIGHHGYMKDCPRADVQKLMTWAMLKGFWQGAIGGACVIAILWILTQGGE